MATNSNSLYNRFSRYVHGGVTETAGNRLEWHERLVIPPDETDISYIVENIYDRRPDMLASVFYNEPRYWLVIAQRNNILDPFSEMTAGTILNIPTKERLMTLLTGRTGGIDSTRATTPIIPPIVI